MSDSDCSDETKLIKEPRAGRSRKKSPEKNREAVAKFRLKNPELIKKRKQVYEQTPKAKEKRRGRARDLYLSNRLRAIEHAGSKCIDCGGIFHHSAMDFHHLNPKTKETAGGRGLDIDCSWPRILKELVKTILLCANCHRIRHYRERNPECTTLK